MTHAGRIESLREYQVAQFLLCLRSEDIRWLSGFTGSTAQLLVDCFAGVGHLFVDGRYVERASSEVAKAQAPVEVHLVESGESIEERIARMVNEAVVQLDDSHLSAAHFTKLTRGLKIEIASSPLDEARRRKDQNELSLIEKAATIADGALLSLLSHGLVGRTEREVQRELDELMRAAGADDVGFDTIVATGPNGARPHHEPGHTRIEDGHMVVIDFGAEVAGYRSDTTRTVQVGNVSPELLDMFRIVEEAQAAGVAAVRAGVVGSDIDRAVRKVFSREGVEHEYVHGTGHGVGLYIHEPPIFSPRCEAVLAANEVVTVEPGLYRKGVGGVRIEDLVVVGDKNCRILTNTPKELLCPRSPRTT